MKLVSTLSHDFPDEVRSRGWIYYRSGVVIIRQASTVAVSARVRGSRDYAVEISWDQGSLSMSCECAYFESSGPCKHIWATILMCDARRYLSAVTWLKSTSPAAVRPAQPAAQSVLQPAPPPPPPPAWRKHILEVAPPERSATPWPPARELLYLVEKSYSQTAGAVVLGLITREPKKNGGWKRPEVPRLARTGLARLPDPADRHILGMLSGSTSHTYWTPSYGSFDLLPTSFRLSDPFAAVIMPQIAATGRCLLRLTSPEQLLPLAWDPGEPWRLHLSLTRPSPDTCAVSASLRRGAEEMDLKIPELIADGLVFTRERIALLEKDAPLPWINHMRHVGQIKAPASDVDQLLAALLEHPLAPHLDLPEDLRYEEVRVAPQVCLTVHSPGRGDWDQQRLCTDLSFDYAGQRVPDWLEASGVYDAAGRRFLVRDRPAEEAARKFLCQLGSIYRPPDMAGQKTSFRLAPEKLPAVVRACMEAGWHVEAEGKAFRRPGEMRFEVSSGIDWFELHGAVDFEGASVKLPALLAALRRGERMVRLDDGSYGMLPEEFLSRFASLAQMGAAEADHLRFQRNQVGLLDALLAAQPQATCDETFARVRDELRHFEGIRAAEQPAGFTGTLRDYQRDGVGWMEFLRRFRFGGCLADDMGVGKTAQVLALLEARRNLRIASNGHPSEDAPRGPSLVVVPKSLVFNWKQEAARFTPQLRVLDHTGMSRSTGSFASSDLVLTTYGTLRRDAAEFKDIEFDYIVLDEAQAIKNAGTESAKAARLLRGRHRLALSGTPVENHLGELWSIFEFLNPGMLGTAGVFKLAGGTTRNPSPETRELLAHALRPFILRRTKEQVARELPPKSEQTIFCEMEPPQRKLYDELRVHYRNSLLGTVAVQGLAKSKIQVLEALLRLRQAACHPGLLDPKRRNDASAKLEVLSSHLGEVVEEGHKALVFSQFTSFLSLVRERLDGQGIPYEYLDGATRDRQQCVERFQTDPACGLFLISLKAGGLGLNLTAAEYVFLLDPWWNPAVEMQAIDRAHRIGQTRQVFAYRLIARDSVEEKILQLQNTKRDLAAAIINADNSLIRDLRTEDLEMLLS